MLRRFNTGYFDGSYSLPAGHVEEGEPALKAAIREAKEEVGIDIKIKDLALVHVVHWISPIPYRHERIGLFFESRKWKGKIKNAEYEKCDDLRWVKINQLPKKMVPETELALKRVAKGITYSEFSF